MAAAGGGGQTEALTNASHIEFDMTLRIILTCSPASMCLEALVQLAHVRHHRALVVRVRLHNNGQSQLEEQRAYRARWLACDISAASKSGLNPSWLSAVPIHEDSVSESDRRPEAAGVLSDRRRARGSAGATSGCWRARAPPPSPTAGGCPGSHTTHGKQSAACSSRLR